MPLHIPDISSSAGPLYRPVPGLSCSTSQQQLHFNNSLPVNTLITLLRQTSPKVRLEQGLQLLAHSQGAGQSPQAFLPSSLIGESNRKGHHQPAGPFKAYYLLGLIVFSKLLRTEEKWCASELLKPCHNSDPVSVLQ